MKVAILGAGAGGASAAVELSAKGHEVRLWNRSPAALAGFRAAQGVNSSGVLGEGFTPVGVITSELNRAAERADVLLVCLPTHAHAALAQSLIHAGVAGIPIVLNPGHTGGALEFRQVFQCNGAVPPPLAEFSTLTYVARLRGPQLVVTTQCAKRVRAAAMPGGALALAAALALYDCARPAANVLETGLSNVNMVLHPPGAILGAAWIEATEGNFRFYVTGLTDGVARVMERLDAERRAVGRAFGIELPSLFDEMQAIGTIEPEVNVGAGLAAAIRAGVANQNIMAPGSFTHRYFQEDLWYGLGPFLALAGVAEIDTPVAQSLMQLGEVAAGAAAPAGRRTAVEMGIAGLDKRALLEFLTERSAA
jgi:opine dehydrogenase